MITTAAADMIRDWLRRAGIADPVVRLIQTSNTPPEIEQALERGATLKEIRHIAPIALAKETKYLYPGIYPRSHFLWIFTTRIGEFRFASCFAYPVYARRAMKRGILDVADRGLVLKDAEGSVVLPKQTTTNAL
jgi:hypothetical protein